MKYMVLERFRAGNSDAVYARFATRGRMLPDGLQFIDSWLAASDDTVWQLMETDDPTLFDTWAANWNDLVEFEIRELKEKPKTEG